MADKVIFLTHGEVEIDPGRAVPDLCLNPTGRARHERFASTPALGTVRAVFASGERKAQEGAAPIAAHLGLPVETDEALGENDRSATGYLPPDAFWPMVDRFFAQPDEAVEGWEPARAAQTRIARAVQHCAQTAPEGDIVIVSHGGVGTLLRCHLKGLEITRAEGQPHPGGGCWFAFDRAMTTQPTQWSAI